MPAMDDFFLSTYHQLTDAARSGRCPVWITEMGLDRIDPPEERERIMADLDVRDTSEGLTARWPGGCPCGNEPLDFIPQRLPWAPAAGRSRSRGRIWHAARVVDGEYLFCWDAFDTYIGPITTDTPRDHAQRLDGALQWRFWWD